jgi:hypothetical protein
VLEEIDGAVTFAVDVGVTPALRRRRERAERQRSFIREQQEATANMRASIGHPDEESEYMRTRTVRNKNHLRPARALILWKGLGIRWPLE